MCRFRVRALVRSPGVRRGKALLSGKTLKLIVDYSAGGPTDIECRIYARHLKKFLKGNPTIVIQNRAGGGGTLAMNWIYERARRNGTVMGCQTASGRYTEWFVGDPKKAGLRANMEEIIPVMFTPVYSVGVARKDLDPPLNKLEDLKKVKSFNVGGFRADGSKDLKFRTLFELAGVKFNYVTGYQGRRTCWRRSSARSSTILTGARRSTFPV